MDAQDLIQSVLRGALTGRRKRGRNAFGYLTHGQGSFLNASTLLTLGGLAWGVYEAATSKTGSLGGGQPSEPTAPPPLPGAGVPMPGNVDPAALRLVRLTISAARADGTLHEAERQKILDEARKAGALELVQAEIEEPRPLSQILAGVSELNQRQDLYVLAFAVVRADETVSGAERIYLAQLAHQLSLSADETQALEELAAARIDARDESALA